MSTEVHPMAVSAANDLVLMREAKPLVHNITNFVVMNETANAILCLGALPVMAHAPEEVEEMVAISGALVLNIGTLTPELVDSMILAGRAANAHGKPVVLDPVGVGATTLRTDSAKRILANVDVAIVCGNAGEIAALGGQAAEVRGVESIGEYDTSALARTLADTAGCTVALTGPVDVVADDSRVIEVRNGHPLLGAMTGSGCTVTSLIGSFAAIQQDSVAAAVEALVAYGLAGEHAAKNASGPGTFRARLHDEIAALTAEDLREGARIRAVV